MCEEAPKQQEPYPMQQDKLPQDMWTHRSIGMRCRSCMWWVHKSDERLKLLNDHENLGRCRRHAPTLGGWPAVFAADWCGDHKLDGGRL